MRYFISVLAGLLIIASGVYGMQREEILRRTPQDSLKCLENLSVASLALEKKMHEHAKGAWMQLFDECPDLSLRIYSDGIKLWEHFVENAENTTRKEECLDTLLLIYDRRAEYFGEHEKYPVGWIIGRKGLTILKYKKENSESVEEAYDCFTKSFNLMQDETEPAVLIAWLQASKVLASVQKISGETFLDNFLSVYSLVYSPEFVRKYKGHLADRARNAVVKIHENSGITDCSDFEKLIERQSGIDELSSKQIGVYIDLLKISDCKDTKLFARLIEKDYQLNPTAVGASELARLFIRRGQYNKAVNYYKDAIEMSSSDSLKAINYYELGVIMDSHFNQHVEARQYAKRASSLLPSWGEPHLLLGRIYARSADLLEGNELEKSAVYWAAVDQFKTAMQKDNSCAEEARKQIEVYSNYFPDKQTCFFHGLSEGQTFVVGDWINEPTVVRFR
jgi:tetratricopeptide (TPR) repeat protein